MKARGRNHQLADRLRDMEVYLRTQGLKQWAYDALTAAIIIHNVPDKPFEPNREEPQ